MTVTFRVQFCDRMWKTTMKMMIPYPFRFVTLDPINAMNKSLVNFDIIKITKIRWNSAESEHFIAFFRRLATNLPESFSIGRCFKTNFVVFNSN